VTCDRLPTVFGDEVQLAELFQNLIANAVKFRSGAPLHIRIRVQVNHAEWQFAIQDNGIGIDPKHADRIFVLFQRLHTHEEYEGTGIGLALCKKIVERHGGRIWVESKPNHGSTFFFTISRRRTE
jgi:light-regulated signal transduction histidine kinase (bacteriophytochrome)